MVGRDAGIPDWLVLVTTLGGIEAADLSGIAIGPLAAALFLTGWQILTDQREAQGELVVDLHVDRWTSTTGAASN